MPTCPCIRRRLFRCAAPEQFSFAVARVENAVAEEHEHIAGLHVELEFVILRLIEQAERQSGRLDHLVLAAMYENGAGKSGVGDR